MLNITHNHTPYTLYPTTKTFWHFFGAEMRKQCIPTSQSVFHHFHQMFIKQPQDTEHQDRRVAGTGLTVWFSKKHFPCPTACTWVIATTGWSSRISLTQISFPAWTGKATGHPHMGIVTPESTNREHTILPPNWAPGAAYPPLGERHPCLTIIHMRNRGYSLSLLLYSDIQSIHKVLPPWSPKWFLNPFTPITTALFVFDWQHWCMWCEFFFNSESPPLKT